MTIIIAYKEKDKIWMGADSQCTDGGTAIHLKTEKIVKKKIENIDIIYGVAGYIRVNNILKYNFNEPQFDENCQTLDDYMYKTWLKSFRKTITKNGFKDTSEGIDNFNDSILLVGIQGRIFRVDSNYQMYEINEDYTCIGSGSSYARGALYVTKCMEIPIDTKVGLALEAACHYNIYCSEPFSILSI